MVALPGIPQVAVDYIRAAAISSMRSQVHILRPIAPVYTQLTGIAVGTSSSTLGYSGPAHIHLSDGGTEQMIADEMMEISSITVSIPIAAIPIPMLEDHVVIDTSDDPALAGETLRIVGVSTGGTLTAVRTLTCTFLQSNPFNPAA